MKYFIKAARWLGVLLLISLIAIGYTLYPLLRGATGYSAKMLCSGIFVEGLSQKRVEQMELSIFPFNKVVNTVDKEHATVKSSMFNLVSQTAVYEDGLGATLYPDGYKQIEGRIQPTFRKQDTLPWPMGAQIADTVPQNIDIKGLKQYIAQQFNETSRAVVVIKDGQLIAEQYANGIHAFTPLLGWSMTKTITAAVTGILISEGKLDIDQTCILEDWKTDARCEITLNNLLQMCSGLEWNEDYSKTSLSDVSRMLYIESDVFDFAHAVKSKVKPDSIWLYSSGTTNIISGIIRNCFDDYTDYYQYPYIKLFHKLGMNHSLIETDAAGNFVASSYGYCSARDWGRLGMLYLNQGKWMDEQILPEWWVAYSTTAAKSSSGRYGAQVWLNASQHYMPNLPADVYFFNGYRGQRVTVIPSKNMVVVCLNSSSEKIDFNSYLSEMLSFVK
jgi:CubicO group peptidase (beta-lactamase class C family)